MHVCSNFSVFFLCVCVLFSVVRKKRFVMALVSWHNGRSEKESKSMMQRRAVELISVSSSMLLAPGSKARSP